MYPVGDPDGDHRRDAASSLYPTPAPGHIHTFMPQGATSSTSTKATIPSLRPEPPSGYIVPPLTNLAALTPHWHARKDAGHWFHGCPQQDANTDPPMEVAVVSHNLAMSSTGSVATGSNIQGVPIIQPSLFIPQIQPRRQLPIIPRGSLNLLERAQISSGQAKPSKTCASMTVASGASNFIHLSRSRKSTAPAISPQAYPPTNKP